MICHRINPVQELACQRSFWRQLGRLRWQASSYQGKFIDPETQNANPKVGVLFSSGGA
jgi:hypothetical protein